MNDNLNELEAGTIPVQRPGKRNGKIWVASGAAIAAVAVAGAVAMHWSTNSAVPSAAPTAPSVAISTPLQRNLDNRLGFLGQFSAVQKVELRAQVGGTLTGIHFKDGDIVHKGDLLFEIDPVPYQIKVSQATAQLESAKARLDLATRELARAQMLKSTDAGTTQNVEQRNAEKLAAQAAVDDAKAQVRDARFDLDRCQITAPFTGRIGTHLVSVGNLVAGSRAATSPTTLLTTLVSLDPIYLDFDMSEGDYMTFLREREKQKDQLTGKVNISLADESTFTHAGTLNFIDNALDRSSGTIHARAVVPNPNLLMTPGGFARVRLAVSVPQSTLLVPDAAVLPDQSDHVVLTVGPNDVVAPKQVQLGDIRGGLRVIKSGLASTDKVIIDGIPYAQPGAKVSPHAGSIHFGSDQG
ncbi:efflux RND transporter periplasmic adaptor subunit [Burkholderia anthina]|uniref:efflux RND transporter periplasmic adaptor subunit n=1 Tax=Burkholderia anthina TaxID=179879 RepID=UPI001CF4D1EB|nr:efflux RND transporter periplasmic adaptor subunit [Burkholderia anthina]MCA8091044.1 efflux RND transporter periplasmic adaptor subunit [Burkholderia anthina]